MGFKAALRGIMPLTTRNAEERLSFLNASFVEQERRMAFLESRLAEATAALGEVARLVEEKGLAAQEDVRGLQGRLASVEEGICEIKAAQRYANAEYCQLRRSDAGSGQILVVGWYGAQNLGDELMLKTLLAHFSDDMLQRTTVLLWDDERYPREEQDLRVRMLHYPRSTWNLELLADSFDVIVWGGGAILDDRQFTDDPANVNTGNLFIRLNELALARHKRVVCLGLSSNSAIEDARYVERLSRIAEAAQIFSIRDPHSLDALRRAGVRTEAMSLCQDIVFANAEAAALHRRARTQVEEGRFKLGVVPLFVGERTAPLAVALDEACDALGWRAPELEVVLIPFLNEGGVDALRCSEVRKRMKNRDRVRVAAYSEQGVLEELASCDACVCYKYHAALLANLAGVPCLSVYSDEHPHYYNKMSYLAELFGCESRLLSSSEFEKDPGGSLVDMLEDAEVPALPEGFLAECEAWLVEACAQIAELASDGGSKR